MNKLKIIGIGSESYPGGRVDSFMVPITQDMHHKYIIPLFRELGFQEENIMEKLDVIFSEHSYIFIYGNPQIKAHLIIEGQTLIIKLDTNKPKEKIIWAFKKYFEFPT